MRDLLGPKNPTKGKFILNSAFIYSRKLIWGNSKKRHKNYLGVKFSQWNLANRCKFWSKGEPIRSMWKWQFSNKQLQLWVKTQKSWVFSKLSKNSMEKKTSINFFTFIWIKDEKRFTRSSSHLEKWFLLRIMNWYGSTLMIISYKHPILVLLPLMEIEMTHTAYFISITLKIISLFLLVWSVCSSIQKLLKKRH